MNVLGQGCVRIRSVRQCRQPQGQPGAVRCGGGTDPAHNEALECACGTGLLSGVIARRCKSLIATDFSANMLRRAEKKYGRLGNVKFERADILRLDFPDGRFDVVVAANVIHLLDEPYKALGELDRVCRPGGRIIVPTYMNRTDRGSTNGLSKAIGRAGADFRREFTLESYRQFFAEAG